MKKAEDYLGYSGTISSCTIDEDADLDDVDNFYYNHKDLVKLIKQIQEDAIRETVKACAKLTENFRGDECYVAGKSSILLVADKLIKEL